MQYLLVSVAVCVDAIIFSSSYRGWGGRGCVDRCKIGWWGHDLGMRWHADGRPREGRGEEGRGGGHWSTVVGEGLGIF